MICTAYVHVILRRSLAGDYWKHQMDPKISVSKPHHPFFCSRKKPNSESNQPHWNGKNRKKRQYFGWNPGAAAAAKNLKQWRLLKLFILTLKGDKTCWEWACYPEISVSVFSLYRLVCTHWEIARRDYWGPSRIQPKSKFALAQVQSDIKTQISLFCPA